VRICIIGNSASAGAGLPDSTLAWPWEAAREVERATGQEFPLTHVSLLPIGSRFAEIALKKGQDAEPDIVVVVIGSFACAIATVSEQVRHRWGARAHGRFVRMEARFHRATRSTDAVAPGRLNRFGRRLARRVIGTRSLVTVEESAANFSEVLRRFAQLEGPQVVVLCEPSWPGWVDRENKGSRDRYFDLVSRVKATADSLSIPWFDCDAPFDNSPDRDALYAADGIHKTVEGHRVQAGVLSQGLLRLTGVGNAVAQADH